MPHRRMLPGEWLLEFAELPMRLLALGVPLARGNLLSGVSYPAEWQKVCGGPGAKWRCWRQSWLQALLVYLGALLVARFRGRGGQPANPECPALQAPFPGENPCDQPKPKMKQHLQALAFWPAGQLYRQLIKQLHRPVV